MNKKKNFQSSFLFFSHTSRMGIDFGDITFLLHVQPVINREYLYGAQGKMTLSKIYDNIAVPYPVQGVVRGIVVHQGECVQYKNVEDIFSVNSTVFMISTVYYGCRGTVIDPSLVKSCGRIKGNVYELVVVSFQYIIYDPSIYFSQFALKCTLNRIFRWHTNDKKQVL